MPSAPPEVESLHFVEYHGRLAYHWPARTAFPESYLAIPSNVTGCAVDGDVVTITAANGTATYHLLRDEPRHGNAIVAELIKGDAPGLLKRRAQKYEAEGG